MGRMQIFRPPPRDLSWPALHLETIWVTTEILEDLEAWQPVQWVGPQVTELINFVAALEAASIQPQQLEGQRAVPEVPVVPVVTKTRLLTRLGSALMIANSH